MSYICKITSNSTHPREYEVDTKSAVKCADLYGRADGGEVVTVYTKGGKAISSVSWSAEERKYIRIAL